MDLLRVDDDDDDDNDDTEEEKEEPLPKKSKTRATRDESSSVRRWGSIATDGSLTDAGPSLQQALCISFTFFVLYIVLASLFRLVS